MPKLSFMKWYPSDWINDTRELSPEAKGAWIDMLCLMWNAPERGTWKGTYQEFARATGLPWELAPAVVRELSLKTANVTFCNAEVTLKNRRMVNQETSYKLASERVRRHRRNANVNRHVTAKTLDSSRLLKTSQDVLKTTPNTNTGAANAAVFDFETLWKRYPKRLGRKEAEKHFKASVKTAADFTAIGCALTNYLHYLREKKVDEQYVKQGSSWFNNWQDWKDYTGGSNGANGSEGVSHYAAIAKRARQSMGLREPPTAGEILAGVRALPALPSEPKAVNGAGERSHGGALETVRARRPENESAGSPRGSPVDELRHGALQRADAD